jgi:gluconokinase
MNEKMIDDDVQCDDATVKVILGVDIGSSSIRCTAYQTKRNNDRHDQSTCPFTLMEILDCAVASPRPSVQPNTGKILVFDEDGTTNNACTIFDTVDSLVEQVLNKLQTRMQDSFQIVAVGFSTFVMNLVAINSETGELLGNHYTISYACNTSEAIQECLHIRQELGEEKLQELYQASGAPLHTSYAIPQLRALYNHQESSVHLQNPHTWHTLANHCITRWTGLQPATLPISYSEASWTGLLNVNACTYEPRAIHLLPSACRDALPPLSDYSDCVHGIPQFARSTCNDGRDAFDEYPVHHPYWKRFPELRDSRFFLGIGDGACANLGSKCTVAHRIAVTIGTSAAARLCLYHPQTSTIVTEKAVDNNHKHERSNTINQTKQTAFIPQFKFEIPKYQGLFCYRIDRDHVLLGGALTDGGSVVEWARDFLNLNQNFEKCLQEMKTLEEQEIIKNKFSSTSTSSTELVMVPFLSGERSTGFRHGASGAVLGLTRATSSAAFFRSCLEGVSLRLKAVLDLIVACHDNTSADEGGGGGEEESKPIVIASGKAMESNDYWRQMIADASNLSIIFDKETEEGTSRGVARLAVLALYGLRVSAYPEPIQIGKISQPRPDATAMYAKKEKHLDGFIDLIAPMF